MERLFNPSLVQVYESTCQLVNGSKPPDWHGLQARLVAASNIQVTVIVPNRNYGALLPVCLKSVIASAKHSGLPWEVLVVDDCSEDSSPEVARRFEGVRVVQLLESRTGGHYGAATVRNVGASLARGHFVMFVDSDDFVYPEYVGAYIAILQHYGVEHVTGAHKRFYPHPRARREWRPSRVCASTERLASIAAYPRAVPLVLGGWSPQAYQLEDVEFNERFDAAGFGHARYGKALYAWRRYRSVAKTRYHDHDEDWRSRISAGRHNGEFPLVRFPLLTDDGVPYQTVGAARHACGAQVRFTPSSFCVSGKASPSIATHEGRG